MRKVAKQAIAVFLAVAVLGILAWRLWPDGGRARRQEQCNSELVRATQTNDLNAATHLLNEGADANAQRPEPAKESPSLLLRRVTWIDKNAGLGSAG